MKRSLCLLLIFILAGCSSAQRTKYQSYKKKKGGGYTVESFEDKLRMVTFRANSYTKKSYAELFAKFRALELCREEGRKYAHLVGLLDKSHSREITRSNANVYGFPSYYYGYSPFYSRYSGIGFNAGFNTVSSNSWNETLVYPNVNVLFQCRDEVYEPDVIFREVPAEEMKHLVKDLKGALQVEKVLEGSPNSALQKGDIILKANGERVTRGWELSRLFTESNTTVPVEILREGDRIKLSLKGTSVSKKVEESQQEIIKAACKFKEIKQRALCRS